MYVYAYLRFNFKIQEWKSENLEKRKVRLHNKVRTFRQE